MTDTCRAAVFLGDGSYEIRRFPIPTPPSGGAVLAVEAVGLCASDVAQLHGHRHVPGEVAPVVPGHEIVGRVHALAPEARLGVAIGQRVGVDLVRRCGACAACRAGSPACTSLTIYGYTRGLDQGSGLFGGYGEYMEILAGTHLIALPEDTPAEELSLFEPLASCLHWLDRVGIEPGETVVVQGPGHMGLILTACARALGAGTIVVSGRARDRTRLEAALAVGADHVVDVDRDDLVAEVGRATDGRGADVVADLADGATATVPLAIELARRGGRILLAGLKQLAPVELVSDRIVLKSLSVFGGAGSTPASMERAGEWLRRRRLPIHELRGEALAIDEIDRAIALLTRTAADDAIRVSLRHRR
jgi:threonine dehydrogenase-like Zn-dependent dehydrogenase